MLAAEAAQIRETPSMAFRTEFSFKLPRGFIDPHSGDVHQQGIMRLATARDEIVPLQDYRV